MVRFKSRYLLFEIYYPNDSPASSATFHTPSPSSANPKAVAAVIRDSIALHFGDLGAGKTGALSGKAFHSLLLNNPTIY
jgi:ribonuclease P/MRP protein subunit POP5